MKAVILAAGEGTRMWPLATTKPKHLLPVAGKPLLSHTLRAVAEAGVKEVCLVVGYRAELIQAAVGSGDEYGITVEYLKQQRRTGTASALRLAKTFAGNDRFLMLYGDLLVDSSAIQAVAEASEECSKVMGVVRLPNPSEYGVVELKKENVARISEKPAKTAKEGWVNSGIYVLDEEVFHAIEKTSLSKRKEYELTNSLQSLIEQGKEVRAAIIAREDWMDIGRPWELLEANERILANLPHRVNGTVESGATLKGSVWMDETALIRSGSYIEGPVYVGKDSTLGPNARIRPFTSIGDKVIIGANCEIKNSIIMNGTSVPHLSYVGDSIIGENCNLGAGTVTANIRLDEQVLSMAVKGRMQSTGRKKIGVIMGDSAQTGINASIMPGVRVGPGARIGPGTVVYNDVPEDHWVFAKQTVATAKKRRR